jgi:hypothetical protein
MISNWITVHFGRNPINDVSPSSDSSVVNNTYFTVVFLFTAIAWFKNEMLYDLAMMVTVDVNSEYSVKHITHKWFPPNIAVSNHPVWLINEYFTILRSDVSFIPHKDPTIIDVRIVSKVSRFIFSKYEIKIIGAAFCTVIINKQFTRLSPSIGLGNHHCSEAAPIFNRNGVVIA